jgi:FkbM family methyltransferase
LVSLAASVRRYALPLARTAFSRSARIGDLDIELHPARDIRWSTIAGNMRVHRLIDEGLQAGETFIDVGAHVGYNTLYGARRVGPRGSVVAVEPAADNVAALRRNLSANDAGHVQVHAVAAGARREVQTFYVRGAESAVNSLAPNSCFGPVTQTIPVQVVPLDELVRGPVHLIKVDVEGGEIAALEGMSRILREQTPRLIVEWHPVLQLAAGHGVTHLPQWLLDHGYRPRLVWHSHSDALNDSDLPAMGRYLLERSASVELAT